MTVSYKAVVIGASAGGFEALQVLLPKFPTGFGMPVIIVQHRAEDSDEFFVEFLNSQSELEVCEAMDKSEIRPGVVYLAPSDYHLLIEDRARFALSVDTRVCCARPSVNVLFESAAHIYRDELIGLVLTGANEDGAKGLKAIHQAGGLTAVQNPQTANSSRMPGAALIQVPTTNVMELEELADFVIAHGKKGRNEIAN